MTDNPASEDLRKAVALLKEGNLAGARLILVDAVTQHPRDELGWFLLSFAVTEPGHQRDCLERVLRINPNNAKARERLEKLGGLPPPEPIPEPVTPPFVAEEGATSGAEALAPVAAPAAAPSAAPAAIPPEPAKAEPVGLPDQHVTPVFIEQGEEFEEELPEEQGEEETAVEEKAAQPSANEPAAEAAPVAPVVPAPAAPVGTPAAGGPPPREARPRAKKGKQRDQAPGWMVAAVVILSVIIAVGALDLGYLNFRSRVVGAGARATQTATPAAAGTTQPATPVVVLPPAWTPTPTPTLTGTPTTTPTPTASSTPSPESTSGSATPKSTAP